MIRALSAIGLAFVVLTLPAPAQENVKKDPVPNQVA